MQKKIYFSLPSFLLILLLGILSIYCYPKKEKNKVLTQKTNIPEENQPLFVVTGFSSELENISWQEVKEKYSKGEVYVLKESLLLADAALGINYKGNKLLENINDFSILAKNNLLIVDLANLTNRFKPLAIDSVNFFENSSKYSFYADFKKNFAFDKNITKFTHTGVTAITRATGMMADKMGAEFIVEKIKPHFQNSDFVHISNEVSFIPNCSYQPGMKFCSKEEHFKALLALKANIIELTGNHNKDFGEKHYAETYKWYKQHNMQVFGGGLTPEQANTPLVITLKDGKKMAFIGFNEKCPLAECAKEPNISGANAYNHEKAKAIIQKIKQTMKVDLLIVSVQFAETDTYAPTPTQDKISKELITFGADVVYGSQAHQVQYVEFYKNKPIFHGMGNFLFDQIHRKSVRQGFFMHHYIYQGRIVYSQPIYTFTSLERRAGLATKQEIKEIKEAIFLDKLIYN